MFPSESIPPLGTKTLHQQSPKQTFCLWTTRSNRKTTCSSYLFIPRPMNFGYGRNIYHDLDCILYPRGHYSSLQGVASSWHKKQVFKSNSSLFHFLCCEVSSFVRSLTVWDVKEETAWWTERANLHPEEVSLPVRTEICSFHDEMFCCKQPATMGWLTCREMLPYLGSRLISTVGKLSFQH